MLLRRALMKGILTPARLTVMTATPRNAGMCIPRRVLVTGIISGIFAVFCSGVYRGKSVPGQEWKDPNTTTRDYFGRDHA